jgi:hypothetical protein
MQTLIAVKIACVSRFLPVTSLQSYIDRLQPQRLREVQPQARCSSYRASFVCFACLRQLSVRYAEWLLCFLLVSRFTSFTMASSGSSPVRRTDDETSSAATGSGSSGKSNHDAGDDFDVASLTRQLASSGLSSSSGNASSRLGKIWASDNNAADDGSSSDFSTPAASSFSDGIGNVFGSNFFSPGKVRVFRGSGIGRGLPNRGLYGFDSGGGSGDELEGGPSISGSAPRLGDVTESSTWKRANSRNSALLCRAFLDLDRPQLSSAMVDHLLSDDACLLGLLDFVARPVDNPTHAGAGALGQEALAALAAGLVPAVDASAQSENDAADRASSPASPQFDLSYYNLVPFGLQAVAASSGSAGKHGSGSAASSAAGFLTPPHPSNSSLTRTANSSRAQSVDFGDSDPLSSDPTGFSLHDADSTYGGDADGGGVDSFSSGADAIPQAVAAAHAAAFAASVADLRYIEDSSFATNGPSAANAAVGAQAMMQ